MKLKYETIKCREDFIKLSNKYKEVVEKGIYSDREEVSNYNVCLSSEVNHAVFDIIYDRYSVVDASIEVTHIPSFIIISGEIETGKGFGNSVKEIIENLGVKKRVEILSKTLKREIKQKPCFVYAIHRHCPKDGVPTEHLHFICIMKSHNDVINILSEFSNKLKELEESIEKRKQK